jgi:hypothetical protein
MTRRVPPAFRRVMVAIITLVVAYLILEAPFLYLEMMNMGPAGDDSLRPGRILLIISSLACGIRRVMASHPRYDGPYKGWLELTPWTSRKPLPLGPVAPIWGDGAYMAMIILLSSTQPEPRSMSLLCLFLLGHLLALLPTLWLGSWAIGYTTAAGMGLAVRFFYNPAACLAAATFTYLIAYEGLCRSLDKFPWPPRPTRPSADNITGDPVVEGSQEVGWPYGQMLVEVRDLRPVSRADAVLGCLLLSWWIDCLAILITDPQKRLNVLGLVSLAILATPFIRLLIYSRGYAAPMTLWARIRMFRPIIPGYDQVFIGPICSLLAGPMTLTLLTAMRAPLDVGLSIADGMVVLVALLTPPGLRRWRLTGAHRMVSTIGAGHLNYVKVG